MDWQEIVSLIVVAAAALLLGRASLRAGKRRGAAACGGSCGRCVSAPAASGTRQQD